MLLLKKHTEDISSVYEIRERLGSSGAPHTSWPSSASPRRPSGARRPWWRMRSQCSVGSVTPTSSLWRMSTRALPTSTWPWNW
ncbi:PNCK isoform 16 [Pan troglodytes]|uniref:PNCK isoform 16 n=1 Tax=Pan troglodytes TaxID=9598 RepID=A0A2J8IPP9_PANTR|nr:PNCK isoform 16 [Pan troglodytes]